MGYAKIRINEGFLCRLLGEGVKASPETPIHDVKIISASMVEGEDEDYLELVVTSSDLPEAPIGKHIPHYPFWLREV